VSSLALLGFNNEPKARQAFERVLHLHSVALLTLEGCALLTRSPGGSFVVADLPPETIGLESVKPSKNFQSLTTELVRDASADDLAHATFAAARIVTDTQPQLLKDVTSVLKDDWVIVSLADDVAETQVYRQLDEFGPVTVVINFTSAADEAPLSQR